jgi:hypothetical protein
MQTVELIYLLINRGDVVARVESNCVYSHVNCNIVQISSVKFTAGSQQLIQNIENKQDLLSVHSRSSNRSIREISAVVKIIFS